MKPIVDIPETLRDELLKLGREEAHRFASALSAINPRSSPDGLTEAWHASASAVMTEVIVVNQRFGFDGDPDFNCETLELAWQAFVARCADIGCPVPVKNAVGRGWKRASRLDKSAL